MAEKPTHSRCNSCLAPMRWVTMEKSGKRNPLDPGPAEDGNILVTDEQNNLARGLTGEEKRNRALLNGADTYNSHFATCPESELHRRLDSEKQGGSYARSK